MLFNSYIFIFMFLPLTLGGYFTINKLGSYKRGEAFLVCMSLWFYAYFNISYLPIILISIVANYYIGKVLNRDKEDRNRKTIMIAGVLGNLSVLFYYKYMGFFTENVNIILGTDYNVSNILLPLGISFFTFQQVSYIVDSYTGEVPQYEFMQYALFVTFFPQLIAGPIVLHNETIPQFANKEKKKFNWDNVAAGIMALSRGMGKKVLIADSFGNLVNYGFQNIESLGSINAILVILSYTVQIYFDFSGYCDVATGIAKMFNIDIPMNFNSPYKAYSITEFWKKWHITLTRFLRTYIYFNLGGNKKGQLRTYINLFIVFMVSGIWHGANYTFIIWGILHGIAMVVEKLLAHRLEKLHMGFRWIYTFLFINFTWVFFRASSITEAIGLFKQVLKFDMKQISSGFASSMNFIEITSVFRLLGSVGQYIAKHHVIFILCIVLISVLNCKNTNEKLEEFRPTIASAFVSIILMVWCVISFAGVSTFLYFNF